MSDQCEVGRSVRALRQRYPHQTKYLVFRYIEVKGRKTPIILVGNHTTDEDLGQIEWLGRWRQFVFAAKRGLMLNRTCLAEIADEIEEVKQGYAKSKEEQVRDQ